MFNRRDAETQRKRDKGEASCESSLFSYPLRFVLTLCLCVSAVNLSCSTKPTDLRTLVPAETLVYLETNDLGAALQPIVDNQAFLDVAKRKPDLSALKGVQLAVAVTGFETSEEKLTDEHSVGRVQPHFVAVADTHAWNYQAVKFAELKLGSFVEDIYDSPPTLAKSDKAGRKYFTWTAKDGRKAFALVIDSLIYFGNDESAIEKCLAVKRGEADSIIKTAKVDSASLETLASGYVSTDGIAQIANIAGLQFASQSSDESEVKSAIAGLLPQLLRGSITGVSWTATKVSQGFEDKFKITTKPEIAQVFAETLAPTGQSDATLFESLPAIMATASLYNLKDPQVAWRSVLLTTQKQTDPLAAKVLGEFSGVFFEPYGIRDPEMFLSSIGGSILTAKIDEEGEKPLVIASLKDAEKAKKSLAADLKPNKQATDETGIEVWKSDDSDVAAAFVGNKIIAGDAGAVMDCLKARAGGNTFDKSPSLVSLLTVNAASATLGGDKNIAAALAEMLSEKSSDSAHAGSIYITETRFTKNGIERKTTSDFGLIGSIIAQLADN